MKQQKDQNMEEMSQEEIPYTVGLVTFSSYCQKIHDQMSKLTQRILSNEIWLLSANEKWAEILEKITVAQFQQLYISPSYTLEQSDALPLLPMIVKINFPSLQTLCLKDIDLLNIEQVAFLNMENLTSLELSQNNIINLQPLNKQKWNLSNYFGLMANTIKGVDLSRMKFNKQLSLLEYNFYRYRQMEAERAQDIFYGDISQVVKLEAQKIGIFRLHQNLNYLEQPKILKKLQERYPGINVQPIKGDTFIINLD